MAKIFISYRRQDSELPAHLIYERLASHFGADNLFLDVDTIPEGADFRKHLDEAVCKADLLLAVIANQWLDARDSEGRRRLDDPDDFVHIEIKTALQRGLPVVPILVGKTLPPSEDELPDDLKELAFHQAFELRTTLPDFRSDLERLVERIERNLQKAMPEEVEWLVEAMGSLEVCPALRGNLFLRGDSDRFEELLVDLSQKLRWTFPRSKKIVVIARQEDYSTDPNGHVFRVQVSSDRQASEYLVKIADPKRLTRELQAWSAVARLSKERKVLLELKAGKPARGVSDEYETIFYESADGVLARNTLATLEEAVCNTCRNNAPSFDSICSIIDQLFAELCDAFYRRSASGFCETNAHEDLKKNLAKVLPLWTSNWRLAACHKKVFNVLSAPSRKILDPCTELMSIVQAEGASRNLRIGVGHGNLHGRNVLVSIVGGEARWPIIYDYERVSNDTIIAWDFVKLEMALKISAMASMSGDERDMIAATYDFEKRLADETEDRDGQPLDDWSHATGQATEQDRLLDILLSIRRQAKRCSILASRPDTSWLEEYYLLLGCYGVCAGQFSHYTERQLYSAFISAVVATNR